MLYENTAKMAGYIPRALEDTAHQATVLLYSPGIDPFLESLSETADMVFYFDEGPDDPPRLVAKTSPKMKNQTTLGAFR